MCITAIVVAVAAAGMGAYADIQSANANAARAAYEHKVRTKQADEQRASAEIQALQQENARTEEFERARSTALAAIGAAGLGEHISFFRGIEPEAQQAFLQDVRNVRLNLIQERSTLADRVQVSEFGSRITRYNSGMAKIGAIADFVNTAMNAYSIYGDNKTPRKP